MHPFIWCCVLFCNAIQIQAREPNASEIKTKLETLFTWLPVEIQNLLFLNQNPELNIFQLKVNGLSDLKISKDRCLKQTDHDTFVNTFAKNMTKPKYKFLISKNYAIHDLYQKIQTYIEQHAYDPGQDQFNILCYLVAHRLQKVDFPAQSLSLFHNFSIIKEKIMQILVELNFNLGINMNGFPLFKVGEELLLNDQSRFLKIVLDIFNKYEFLGLKWKMNDVDDLNMKIVRQMPEKFLVCGQWRQDTKSIGNHINNKHMFNLARNYLVRIIHEKTHKDPLAKIKHSLSRSTVASFNLIREATMVEAKQQMSCWERNIHFIPDEDIMMAMANLCHQHQHSNETIRWKMTVKNLLDGIGLNETYPYFDVPHQIDCDLDKFHSYFTANKSNLANTLHLYLDARMQRLLSLEWIKELEEEMMFKDKYQKNFDTTQPKSDAFLKRSLSLRSLNRGSEDDQDFFIQFPLQEIGMSLQKLIDIKNARKHKAMMVGERINTRNVINYAFECWVATHGLDKHLFQDTWIEPKESQVKKLITGKLIQNKYESSGLLSAHEKYLILSGQVHQMLELLIPHYDPTKLHLPPTRKKMSISTFFSQILKILENLITGRYKMKVTTEEDRLDYFINYQFLSNAFQFALKIIKDMDTKCFPTPIYRNTVPLTEMEVLQIVHKIMVKFIMSPAIKKFTSLYSSLCLEIDYFNLINHKFFSVNYSWLIRYFSNEMKIYKDLVDIEFAYVQPDVVMIC